MLHVNHCFILHYYIDVIDCYVTCADALAGAV